MEVRLLSKSGQQPQWIRGVLLVLGMLVLGHALQRYLMTTKDSLPSFLVGGACFFLAGLRKRLYIAPEGVVREIRCWGKTREILLPWGDVEHVTLVFFKEDMMAFFELRGSVRGWRLYFRRDDEGPLRRLIKEYIPGVEVATQEKRF
ncbi:MAG: hypothetical protein BWY88_00362 [Synergistetes bacterium ADurb.Bin520]|nr:MAG: hypothetical protein BWY88_00362 [Synergistetes bacterium ADurb.Bin520]